MFSNLELGFRPSLINDLNFGVLHIDTIYNLAYKDYLICIKEKNRESKSVFFSSVTVSCFTVLQENDNIVFHVIVMCNELDNYLIFFFLFVCDLIICRGSFKRVDKFGIKFHFINIKK